MKKIILNMSDITYLKLQYEALEEKKSINQIIGERILYKKFSEDVENAYEKNLEDELKKLFKEQNLETKKIIREN